MTLARQPMRPAFRPVELSLLMLPALYMLGGLAIIQLANGHQPALVDLLPMLALVGLALAVHVVLSAIGFRGDQFVFPLCLALTGIGLVIIARLDPKDLFIRQIGWAALGLIVMVATVALVRDPRTLRRYKYTAAAIGLGLVAITLVLGRDINDSGVRLWLGIGPLLFQPSEILKVLLVIFFAGYLEEYGEILAVDRYRLGPLQLPPLPYLIPIVVMWGLSLILFVFQRDLGSALLFFGIFLAMLFVASGRLLYVLASLIAFAAGAAFCYRFLPVVQLRVAIWLDPWSQSQTAGYQIVQAIVALASGGVLGAGLGAGQPYYIPAVATDFVFSAIGEELGLAGTLAVLLIYILLVHRGFRIALRATNPFDQLLAAGLTTVLGFQTLVILAGNLRLIPLTGITLPFISYGGSSLVTNFILAGLLMTISRPLIRT